MPYRSSLETSLKVLKVLALEKEYCQYNLPKRIGKDYRTILRHLESLKERGLIQLQRTEGSKKKGKERNILGITLNGLLCVLHLENMWKDIDIIAEKHASKLPLIFGKWAFFTRRGIKDEVIERLTGAVLTVSEQWSEVWPINFLGNLLQSFRTHQWQDDFYKELLHGIKKEKALEHLIAAERATQEAITEFQEIQERSLTNVVIFGLQKWHIPLQEQKKFMSTLKDDPDLDQYIQVQLDELKTEYTSHLENIKSLRTWWESLESRGTP